LTDAAPIKERGLPKKALGGREGGAHRQIAGPTPIKGETQLDPFQATSSPVGKSLVQQ